jgi:hypothetical protein
LPPQTGVFLGELPVAVEGDGEPGAEGWIAGPLACGRRGAGRRGGGAQFLDLAAQVGLGV